MTTDLWCLIAISLWTVVLNYLPLFGRIAAMGMAAGTKMGFGNRHDQPAGDAWVQRGDRAHRNHLENLPIFMALVLVGKVTGRQDHTTALACMVFVGARVAHSLFYVAGIRYLRTLAYWTSLAAMGWLLLKLLRG